MAEFMVRCLDFKQVKAQCKHPSGLLQPIPILEWKWGLISMDFIIVFPRASRHNDSSMVVVEGLTKVVHFIAVKSTYSANDVAQVFMRDIVRLHGVPKKIVSDRDAKITSRFWKELFASLGTELAFNIAYHSQIYEHIERVNRIL